MNELCVIILNYRRADLTIECLRSLADALEGHPRRVAVVVDNGSGDDSADRLEQAIVENRWDGWARLLRSPVNGGFAAGNNIGFEAEEAEAYLLLNSDARVKPGAIDGLLRSMRDHPDAGLIGPRLQGPDGRAQVSCFRYRTPVSELLEAAGTGLLDRWLSRCVVAAGVHDQPVEAQWVSFACVLIRKAVIERIGPMDEKYFMYFEDMDYARRARRAGWGVLHDPTMSVIHLRGGSSSVKRAFRRRSRVPRYYYESRSRYFAKYYGGILGILAANACWYLGRGVALLREICGAKRVHACACASRDIWTNCLTPLRTPTSPTGGEL